MGFGIDFSGEMIMRARQNHPELKFIQADIHELNLNQFFDVVILSDILNDLWDVQFVFQQLSRVTKPHTRIIINSDSRLWERPLSLAQKMGLARSMLCQNWLTVDDLTNLLNLSGFEVIHHWEEIIWPLRTIFLDALFNKFLVKIWPFKYLALTNFILARPQPTNLSQDREPSVSVIIPTRNEAGNIPDIFARIPQISRETEWIFVEGHSKDNTYTAIKKTIADHPELNCKLLRQSGIGKGDAVRFGFSQADGEVLNDSRCRLDRYS